MGLNEFLSSVDQIGVTHFDLYSRLRIARDPAKGACAVLVCTISEQFVAAIEVLRSRASSHALVLIRSMMEAEVTFLSLLRDHTVFRRLDYTSAVRQVTTLEGFLADETMGTHESVVKMIPDLESARVTVAECERDGVKRIEIKERFKIARREELYGSVYSFLCSSTHNDFNALHVRHLRENSIVVFDPLPAEMVISATGIMKLILDEITAALPSFSSIQAEEAARVCRQAEELWEPAVGAFRGANQ